MKGSSCDGAAAARAADSMVQFAITSEPADLRWGRGRTGRGQTDAVKWRVMYDAPRWGHDQAGRGQFVVPTRVHGLQGPAMGSRPGRPRTRPTRIWRVPGIQSLRLGCDRAGDGQV
jgi:hypothetical protein